MLSLQRVVVEAPAKINLFLGITGRADNGYHLLDTVMQAVDLRDIVVVGRAGGTGIRVTCSRPDIPEDERNLAYRAAALFLQETTLPPMGLHLHIDKAIPSQAGLGGGSADGAAVLVGLSRLTGANLPEERLCSLALRLGADVPFAIRGGCVHAEGVGERMSSLFPGLRPCRLVIAKPGAGVSTPEAYRRFDEAGHPPERPPSSQAIQLALATGDLAKTGARLYNVFEQACPSPDTERLKSRMADHGAVGSVLSGSGSAVVGVFADSDQAETCAKALSGIAEEVFLARPVNHGARILHES